MALERTDQLGTIKINDAVFAKIVLRGIERADGKAYCASERAKILGGIDQKVTAGELASHIRIWEANGENFLEFYVIMNFGSSISQVSQGILDYVVGEMRTMFPQASGKVILKIVGVKSKKIAVRNVTVERSYEPAR